MADAIPGDFSAIDVNQKDVRLESFGAFGVDVWDPINGGDVPYTLAQNCEATFNVDVPLAMRGYAPASILLLEYDPPGATGMKRRRRPLSMAQPGPERCPVFRSGIWI